VLVPAGPAGVLVAAKRPLGLATGEEGFNRDFHAISHHGDDTVLGKHYIPRRSQRTRAKTCRVTRGRRGEEEEEEEEVRWNEQADTGSPPST
jgi:hypothetical protein